MQVQYERELRLQYTLLTCSGACEKCNKPDYTLGGHLMAVLKSLLVHFLDVGLRHFNLFCTPHWQFSSSKANKRPLAELNVLVETERRPEAIWGDFSQPLCRQPYHWAKFERCMIWTHVHKIEIWNNEKHDIKRFAFMVPINEKEKYTFSFQNDKFKGFTYALPHRI